MGKRADGEVEHYAPQAAVGGRRGGPTGAVVQLLLLPGWVAVGVAVGVSRAGSAVVLVVATSVRFVVLRAVREETEVTVAAAQLGGRGASLLAGGLGGGVPGNALLVGLD